MICRACGFALAAVGRFCGGCGKEVPASGSVVALAEAEAELRQVSVLFCDLVGSTEMSQRLDPEDLRELVDAYQRACGAVVQAHDGYVAQYLGDGLLVYFGFPHAHEDDPVRVVRCALDMVMAVREVATTTQVDLQVRVGIHSGRVVVGALGGGARSERLAIGDTPNIAARVQGQAAPGQILVSHTLHRLLGRAFKTEGIGPHVLKGVDLPMALFRVLGRSDPADGPDATRTAFVGRAREREQLSRSWAQAVAGKSQFALLQGEAGIGKSRLLEVAQDDIAHGRIDVLVARCTPVAIDSALHPIIEMMGARLGLAGLSEPDRTKCLAERMAALSLPVAQAVPLFAAMLGIGVDAAQWPAPELSAVRARQRTLELLIEVIQALTRDRPVLFVIEDLHWADPSTLEFLHQLLATSAPLRLMVLLTARPEFKPTWAEATNLQRIVLDGLDPEAVESLIRKVAKDKPLPVGVVWLIRERASGNALFLEEITRSVVESGVLVEHAEAWQLVGPLAEDAVPASMEASLMARIDRLGQARALLQLGAVVGREFSHDLLAAVAEISADTVQRHVELMLASGLVYDHAEHSRTYIFKHALVRDAAYSSLLRSTRQRYHARIAAVLAQQFPEMARLRPELLAHHLSGAGAYAQAAIHRQAAGEDAAARSAVNEAVAHFRQALDDLARLPEDNERMDHELAVLTALAPVQMAAFGWASAEVGQSSSRAIALAQKLGAHDRMYSPMWALWANQFVGGRLGPAHTSAQSVLAMALATGSPMLWITGHHASCYTHYYRGEYAPAMVQAELGMGHYTFALDLQICQIFQLSSIINILCVKGCTLWMQGRQDDGAAVIDDMLAHARALKHPPSIAAALAFAMFFTLYDRDWKRMFSCADEVYQLSRAEGYAMWMANSGMHRGRARIALGQREAGLAEVLEWGALFSQTGSGSIEGSTTSMISEALHWCGRDDEALAASAEGEQRALDGEVGVMLPEIYRTRGDILRDMGRMGDARKAYHQAIDCARAQAALSLELRALTALVDMLGDSAAPAGLVAELRSALARMVCSTDRPDMVSALALLQRLGA